MNTEMRIPLSLAIQSIKLADPIDIVNYARGVSDGTNIEYPVFTSQHLKSTTEETIEAIKEVALKTEFYHYQMVKRKVLFDLFVIALCVMASFSIHLIFAAIAAFYFRDTLLDVLDLCAYEKIYDTIPIGAEY